jgi:hypothetical protein
MKRAEYAAAVGWNETEKINLPLDRYGPTKKDTHEMDGAVMGPKHIQLTNA